MHRTRFAVAGLALLALCGAGPTTNPDDVKGSRAGFVRGYLGTDALVDSLALLPPPPEPGSPAAAADAEVYRHSRTLKESPRWRLATRDAELKFPKAADAFACALGIEISAEATPHLNMLLRRTLADAGLATYKAKNKYVRTRPFMANNDATCTPSDEEVLRKDGSYPSGHAALGWAWALVLVELAPDRADAVARRGLEFASSRTVCGVHWQSDVNAGMIVASAVVAQLHANGDFLAQAAEARREIAAQRAATRSAPEAACRLESEVRSK